MADRATTIEIRGDASAIIDALRASGLDFKESVSVERESLTYQDGGENSYFRDLLDGFGGDNAANARLARHAREVKDEIERRDRAARRAPDVEYRTNPNRTSGLGGSFAPPIWLIDAFATAPRAKRVLAAQIPNFELPLGVSSVNLPRLTTGNVEQPVADSSADPNADALDAAVSCTVVTISGHGDVAMQALEQSGGSGLDYAFLKDLNEAYDAQAEAQLIAGTGNANAQLPGLLSLVPAANQVAYTDATPTATEMFSSLGKTVAAVGNSRKLPPEAWLMTTSRLAWLGSSEDNQNRPLMLTDRDGSGNVDLLAYPVEPDDAVPTNLTYNSATHNWTTGGTQDVIVACRPSDSMLFESTPRASVQTEVLSGTLQARIQMHRYVAVLHRYPSGIAVLCDTGMTVQSGF